MRKYVFACALFLLIGSAPALRADSGVEYANGIILSKDGNFFIVSKETHFKDPTRAFIAQKVEFSYEIQLVDSDKGGKILSTHKGTLTIPAGKIETRIDAARYVNELKDKIKSRGYVNLEARVRSGADYRGPNSNESIEVVNEKYKQELIDTAKNNPELMGKYLKDYQDFLMKNADKDQDTINREFLKKYPQYRVFMPQYQ